MSRNRVIRGRNRRRARFARQAVARIQREVESALKGHVGEWPTPDAAFAMAERVSRIHLAAPRAIEVVGCTLDGTILTAQLRIKPWLLSPEQLAALDEQGLLG